MQVITNTAESTDLLEVHPHRDSLSLVPSPPPADAVTVERKITAALHDALYDIYVAAFTPLAARAALCHVLTRESFVALLVDPGVLKVVAWDTDGVPAGLATLTTDLSTELVGAEFYTRRFPEAHAADGLYYLGFLLVRPDAQRSGILQRLIRGVVDQVSAAGGVVAFDVCGYNDDTFQFAKVASALAARIRPAVLEKIDVQTYYAVSFPATG
jgi:GNAT superfamily N-acetyltransferase